MKTIVISGINLFEGGPLSVFYDCLDAILELNLNQEYKIIVFVHKKELFYKYKMEMTLIELPKSRKSYIHRLYYEYCYFYEYSKKNDIYIWLSLHDITPKVKAKKLYTYCHNPSPFMKKDLRNIKYSLNNVMFSFFYKYLYKINIKKATGIIVQQNWLREKFKELYFVQNVIVARPTFQVEYVYEKEKNRKEEKKIFLYAAFPRFFKNFEVICKACKKVSSDKFEVWLTIDGSENRYSKDLKKKYENIENIKWLGVQSRKEVFGLYDKVDCLIFPSKLETWGLPISEFKETEKDMILVDLPYSYETLGEYERVMFFEEDNFEELGKCMQSVVENTQKYSPQRKIEPEQPYADSWNSLIKRLVVNEDAEN